MDPFQQQRQAVFVGRLHLYILCMCTRAYLRVILFVTVGQRENETGELMYVHTYYYVFVLLCACACVCVGSSSEVPC